MKAPSRDIGELLQAETSLGLTMGTNLFANILPEGVDNVVSVNDYGGMEPGQYDMRKPSLQIYVRNNDSEVGYNLLNNIYYFLNEKRNFTINDSRYIQIRAKAEIQPLPRDEENRHIWSLNFQIIRTGTNT